MLRIAELSQNVGGIGAKPRRPVRRRRVAARESEARAHDLDGAVDAGRGVERADELPLNDLRMLEHRWHVEHLAGRHAVLVEKIRPLLRRLGGERTLDLGIERETMALA